MLYHLTIACAVVLVVGSVVVYSQFKKQRRQLSQLQEHILKLERELLLSNERFVHIKNVCGEIQSDSIEIKSAISQINQVCELQQALGQELQNKVQLLESSNDENKLYARANKLFELGADVDEVMQECGLSKTEAELLKSLKA